MRKLGFLVKKGTVSGWQTKAKSKLGNRMKDRENQVTKQTV